MFRMHKVLIPRYLWKGLLDITLYQNNNQLSPSWYAEDFAVNMGCHSTGRDWYGDWILYGKNVGSEVLYG
jgi:hypothetical protein